MKKNWLFYLTLILSLATLAINLAAYPHMPNRIPVHWGINGEPNRYGSRIEQIVLGALPLVIFILLNYLPYIDPRRDSYKKHAGAYSVISFVIILFISIMNLAGLFSTLGYPVPFQKVVPAFIGILFIILGNYTTQLRHNYFVGFRTPWALASEHVWKKTNRFGGYTFVVIGFIPFLSFLIGAIAMYIFLGAMIIGIVLVYLYSYLVFKKNR